MSPRWVALCAPTVSGDTSPGGSVGSRRGAAVDGCGRRLGTVVPWPSYLRRVIDLPRSSRRHAAPLDGGPPERGDKSLWAWDDCRTPVCHTQPWVVPHNTSATHCLSCIPCTWCTRAGAVWCGAITVFDAVLRAAARIPQWLQPHPQSRAR